MLLATACIYYRYQLENEVLLDFRDASQVPMVESDVRRALIAANCLRFES